jgi:DHA1 family inner membrane transport protein
MFASQAGLLVLSPLLTEIAGEFGISTAAAGQLRTISGATGGITAIALAVAGRRPGLRTMLLGGAGMLGLGSLTSAAAPSFLVLAAAQAVMGIGIGVLVAIAIAAAGEWSSPAERPHTLAWAIAGMPVAWVVGMPIVGAAQSLDWRVAFLAVPAASALAALALVALRPADPSTRRTANAVGAWRRPDVARFALGELLANAAWASVLTYVGALLIETYGSAHATVALGLAFAATAMVPGTFLSRRHAGVASTGFLVALTLGQAVGVLILTTVREAAAVTFVMLAAMAFTNGWRSMVASTLGMDSAPDDKVAVMAMRAAANQLGYLLGAGAGGLAIALGGFPALGAALAAMFVLGATAHAWPAITRGVLGPALATAEG